MTSPIAGERASMTSGNATAIATIRTASARRTEMRGEDNSMTGNSVHADMDHNEVSRTARSGASNAGNTSVAQNAAAASRRSAAPGQAMSASALPVGRAIANTTRSGTQTYAMLPTR